MMAGKGTGGQGKGAARALRGQPLVVLLAVLAGWLGGRVAMAGSGLSTSASFPATLASAPRHPAGASQMSPAESGYAMPLVEGPQSPARFVPESEAAPAPWAPAALDEGQLVHLLLALLEQRQGGGRQASYLDQVARGQSRQPAWQGQRRDPHPGQFGGQYPGQYRGEDARFFLAPAEAGFAQEPVGASGYYGEPLPGGFGAVPVQEPAAMGAGAGAQPAGPAATGPGEGAKPRRWSADAWALVRGGESAVLGSGVLPATYGGSQAGAVLRYRLGLKSAQSLTAYMRTTSSLGALQETSAALGLGLRPLPAIPVVTSLEGRLTSGPGGTRVQPVALAVTEIPALELPGRFRAEMYGQAGYVAGEFATPFADGQVRADRTLLRLGAIETRLGAGMWGGAQKGAARLDAGPAAMVTMPLGKRRFGRIALDWRFRVAGDAAPGSGPALTLSAGF